MKKVLLRSALFSAAAVAASYFLRSRFHTELYLADVSGLSAFLSVFGTLYGILTAFFVFEVWTQYNRISELIDKEAQGLERLYRLTLYFRDEGFTSKMKVAISEYANLVINGNFKTLAQGGRNVQNGIAFRKMADIIREIQFNDDHDSIVYSQVLEHYGELAQVRTERRNQSLSRLPVQLKTFIYISSFFALVTFLVMPFAQAIYGYLSVLIISFLQAMIFQMVEDLDNPFVGEWALTPEPFARAMKHIDEDY
jgi:hypothetical protein